MAGHTVSVSSNKITINGVTTTATASTISGYDVSFSSWSKTSGSFSADTTITASFTKTPSTALVTFDANGGQIGGYVVKPVDGAAYGFNDLGNGWYESTNKGVNSSYAICKLEFYAEAGKTITLSVINYAESNYDYALFSNLDTMLTSSAYADSSGVAYNFKGQSSSSTVSKTWSVTSTGSHFICVKFIKDSSASNYNDSVKFMVYSGIGMAESTKTVTYSVGQTLGTLPVALRSGYTFKGWYTATSGGTQVSTSTVVTGTKTYYAQWTNMTIAVAKYSASPTTGCSYYVYKSGASNQTTTSITITGSTTVVFKAVVSSGYTFKGWYNSSGSKLSSSTTYTVNLSAGVTYYAYWTKNTTTYTCLCDACSNTVSSAMGTCSYCSANGGWCAVCGTCDRHCTCYSYDDGCACCGSTDLYDGIHCYTCYASAAHCEYCGACLHHPCGHM